MNKFFSLLKAMMSQDMQVFKFNAKSGSSIFAKILIPMILSALLMFSIGSMYAPLAIELSNVGLTFIILEVAILVPTILAFFEGMYKSQSILFEAKDSELLFSLPVSKKCVLFARVTKLYIFQLLYSLLFTLPGIAIYAYYERPTAYFYLITFFMLVLFPIIPTVLGCIIGFITKQVSVNFKAKKVAQLVITFALASTIMILSFNSQNVISSITEKANEIGQTIRSVYYPIDAYIDLINGFNIIKAILLIGINVAFVMFFVYVFGKNYFRVLTKSKENLSYNNNVKIDIYNLNYKKACRLNALLKKELNRYFSSTVYVFNTMFGMVLLVIATVALCLNFDSSISYISSGEMPIEDIATLHMLAPKVFLVIIIAMSFMTSITSSSISLEGKTFNISKSLPVKEDLILLAKVLMSDIITIPVILICDLIFMFSFKVSVMDVFLIIVTSFIAPSIAAVFGLIVNLRYPKMNASSDTEVVKQSMSSMISVFGGIILSGVFVALTFFMAAFGDTAMILEIVILSLILLVLWNHLVKVGKKKFRQIEC